MSSSIIGKKMSKRTHDGQKKASTNMFKVPSQIMTRSFRKNSARCLRKSVSKTTKAQSSSTSKVKKIQPSKPSLKSVTKTRRKSAIPRKNTADSEKNESTQKNEKTSISTQSTLNKSNSSHRTTLKQRCLASHSGCSFAELIHIRELGEELTDEDLLEIVHCPSPVWWEDPPNESYDEDPIFGRVSHATTSSAEHSTRTNQSPTASETTELKIPRIPDSKCDQKFLTKRSTLENILQHLSKKNSSKSLNNADDSSTAQQLRKFRKTKSYSVTSTDNDQKKEYDKSRSQDNESKLNSNQCITEADCGKSKTILNPVIQSDQYKLEIVKKSSGFLETEEVNSPDVCGNNKLAPSTSINHQTIHKTTSLALNDGSTTLKKIVSTKELQTVLTYNDKSSSTDLKKSMPTKRVYSGSDSAEIIPHDVNSNPTDSSKKSEGDENEVIDLCEELESDKNLLENDSLVLGGKEYEILKDFESLKVPISDISDEITVIEESENYGDNFQGQLECHTQIDDVSNFRQNKNSTAQENRERTEKEIENIETTKINTFFSDTVTKGLKRKRSNSDSSLSQKPKIVCKDDSSTKEDIVKEYDKSSDPLGKIPKYVIESTLAKENNSEKIRSAYNEMLTKIRSRIKNRKVSNTKIKIIAMPKNGNQSSTPAMELKKNCQSKDSYKSLLKSNIETPDKTYLTAERSVIKTLPVQTSSPYEESIKIDKSKNNSTKGFLKLRAIDTTAKTQYKMEKSFIRVLSAQSLIPDKQFKTIMSKDILGKSFLKSRAIATPAKKLSTEEKSIIKVLPTQMSREMIDEIIGIKNTEIHKNPESLEDILSPDLAVKKDIIIEHKDNVKYCFKCSSIYNTIECSYCVEPKHTADDKIVVQKLYSCDLREYKTTENSTADTKTANHGQENLHTS